MQTSAHELWLKEVVLDWLLPVGCLMIIVLI